MSLTVMDTVAVSLPPEFVAVTVYVAVELTTVGVPEIIPSVVLKTNRPGKVGEMDHDVTAPPLAEGVTEVMAVPLVSVKVAGL